MAIVWWLRAIQREVVMPAQRVREFLDSNGVKYVSIKHSLAYTAQEIAASAHISGKEVAKTVIVKLGDEMAMAVLPASRRIHFKRLMEAAGADQVELATENEFKVLFPGCEVGAMPPFGNLYDVPVYVDESLAEDEEIAFNAGSHTELIRLAYEDFARLVKPTVAHFSARLLLSCSCAHLLHCRRRRQSGRLDLNQRPPGPKPGALPD